MGCCGRLGLGETDVALVNEFCDSRGLMRLLCEIVVIGALIYLGWEKPLRDWTLWRNTSGAAPAGRQSSVQVGVDRPAYDDSRTFTGHITYVDEKGRKYWLDARGTRHYDP